MEDPFRQIGESFGASIGKGMWLLLALIFVALAVILLRMAWPGFAQWREARARFRRFCDAGGLTAVEARLVRRLAALKFPDHPDLIFVSPSALDAAAQAERVDVSTLKAKLFV